MTKLKSATKLLLILSAVSIAVLSGCAGNLSTPAQLNDGIQTANIKDYISDTAKLEQLIERSEQGKLKKQDSLLIMKDGKLVLEKYYGDWSRNKLHNLRSVSKSVTALLIGEALEKKVIKSINDPIKNYLPKYKEHFNGGKEKITVKHLLNMTAGLAWNEDSFPYSDSINYATQEAAKSDGGKFTLSQKLMYTPGTFFNYNSGLTNLLGMVLNNAAQEKSFTIYLEASFLNKLLIPEVSRLDTSSWIIKKDGNLSVSRGIHLWPRSMLKIGQLVLNNGKLNGEQIINENFIKEMTKSHIKILNTHKFIWLDYGYGWWIRDFKINNKTYRAIAARGDGGQLIAIIKDLNLIVVKTASNYDHDDFNDLFLEKFIIPAFVK